MSKEVNRSTANLTLANLTLTDILEKDKHLSPQLEGSANADCYDALCYSLPHILIHRKFNEVEAKRVCHFLETIRSDIQYINTVRAIFILKTSGEIDSKWAHAIMEGKGETYFWKRFDGVIKNRVLHIFNNSTSLEDAIKMLVGKIKKGTNEN